MCLKACKRLFLIPNFFLHYSQLDYFLKAILLRSPIYGSSVFQIHYMTLHNCFKGFFINFKDVHTNSNTAQVSPVTCVNCNHTKDCVLFYFFLFYFFYQPHTVVSRLYGRPCKAGTWLWRGWGTTEKHTCEPRAPHLGNGCTGLVYIPSKDKVIQGFKNIEGEKHIEGKGKYDQRNAN